MFIETVLPRFSETDALGHINNTVLPVWFEAARVPVFKLFTPELNPQQWKLLVAKIEVLFLKEIFYGDEVTIKTYVNKIGTTSFVLSQHLYQKGQCCAQGNTVMVRYDFSCKSKQALSKSERAALSEHLQLESEKNI